MTVKNTIGSVAMLATYSAGGAAAAIAIEKAVIRFGHGFMRFGPDSLFLLGVIGAIQNCAALSLAVLLKDKFHVHDIKSLVISQLAVAACLTGLTALAARFNQISTSSPIGINPLAMVALLVCNAIVTLGLGLGFMLINKIGSPQES